MTLWQMSFSGSVLILAILAVRKLASPRLPKRAFPVMWAAAVLRLLLPVSIPCPWSIYSLPEKIKSAFQPVYGLSEQGVQASDAAIARTFVMHPAQIAVPAGASHSFILVLWGIGMGVCGAFFLITYLHWQGRFRESLPVFNIFTVEWLKAHPLGRPVSVRQSDRIDSPLTYGSLRPVILLPKEIDWEDGEQLSYILFHEYTHIRRWDTAVKLTALLAVCVHWFNPLAWVMLSLLERDLELACDECVVKHFGEGSRTAYARALISMAEEKNKLSPLGSGLSFGGNHMEERISSIIKRKKWAASTLGFVIVLLCGVTAVFATSPKQEEGVFPVAAQGEKACYRLENGELTDITGIEYDRMDFVFAWGAVCFPEDAPMGQTDCILSWSISPEEQPYSLKVTGGLLAEMLAWSREERIDMPIVSLEEEDGIKLYYPYVANGTEVLISLEDLARDSQMNHGEKLSQGEQMIQDASEQMRQARKTV